MLAFILEAAFRSLLMATAVWACIRVLRVQAVLAQKTAWILVLVAAGTMPLVMRAPFLALDKALRIPIRSLPASSQATPIFPASPSSSVTAGESILTVRMTPSARIKIPVTPSSHSTKRSAHAFSSSGVSSAASSSPAIHVTASDSSSESGKPTVELVSGPETPAASSSMSALLRSSFDSVAALCKPGFWTVARVGMLSVMIYFGVAGILLLRILLGLGMALRVWLRARPITNFSIGESSDLRVRISRDMSTPVTIGSSVILPADYVEWDESKLRIVLAHEQSHVRQGDFYLQLLAAVYVAAFWFSPLGWWLQRKLSELGEALSDRAGLEQAPSPASYAQVLLEFAAMPRTTLTRGNLVGVAMARSSNLSSRIERILNDRRFQLAFLGGRRHALLSAILVPTALVAVIACIRIVPAVEAAQAPKIAPANAKVSVVVTGQAMSQVAPVASDQVTTVNFAQATAPVAPVLAPVTPEAPSIPAVAPVPPVAPAPDVEVPQPPDSDEVQESEAPPAPGHKHNSQIWINNDNGENFAIVHENGDGTVHWNGEYNNDLAKIRKKMNLHGDYIWIERDGKSYVITDPALLAKAQELFKGDPELNRRMAELDQKQAILQKKMADLEPEMLKAEIPGPEFAQQMAKLQTQIAELQNGELKKLTVQVSKNISEMKLDELQEKMGDLQEKIGDLQGQIGEIQGQIGERQGEVGEKQGAIGEQMGKLGEEMGKIGEQQGKQAEAASKKLKSILDQAIKEGRAKPVE